MNTFPQNLDEVVKQAKAATKSAIADGYQRIQVELVVAEIALKAQLLAIEFAEMFEEYGTGVKVMFPDTGAAMLARRDWGDKPFQVTDMGSRFTDIETQVSPEDKLFIVVAPSAVEVGRAEKLCNLAGDRPVVFLIPQLEDVSVVGIGYAARQIRERFISTIHTSYYFRLLDGAAILRCYPAKWQVWLETETGYELATELNNKPIGEDLELLLTKLTSSQPDGDKASTKPKKSGILSNLQSFLKALSQ
ncbi:DUF1995 family protein [Myxosarcina sp. GI1]|uniref:DUF1995 family protein n=1 Tax=Myxosarcina sp. GI1 TaxID=1541065 RepID=UPI00055FD4D0|nr:DUF1995 family protein [Myxosarcina sp. GI1]